MYSVIIAMASKKNANKNQTQGNRKCDNIDDIRAHYDEKFNNGGG